MRGWLRFIKELFRFNFVDRRAKIGKNVRIDHFVVIEHNVAIGDNTWIGGWTHIRPDTKIGHDSEIRDQCYVSGHGVVIGNNTKICQKSSVAAGMKIGNKCFITNIFAANTKDIEHHRTIPRSKYIGPVIEDNVRIGINVTILPGVRIAKDSYIGAGAVVVKDTEPYGVYVGNPAKKIKEVSLEERVKG